MVEETILPPSNSVELARTAQTEYVQRLGIRQPNIAELYHVNSKLTPFTRVGLPVDERGLADARETLRTTAYRVRDSDLEPGQEHLTKVPHAECPPGLRALLEPFVTLGPTAELLYALDLFAISGSVVYRQPQLVPYLWRERQWNPMQRAMFAQSLLRVPPKLAAEAETVLVLAAAPWRYQMFLGPRGYRHVMADLGRLLDRLDLVAGEAGVPIATTMDFFDSRVDRLLLLDGVERSAVAVVLVGSREEGS